jgi:methyltransferase (TIGR00027 family)
MRGSQPSATAHLIARSLVLLSRDPRHRRLVPAEVVEASVWFMEAASSRTPLLLWLMERAWFRRAAGALERLVLPGITLHYAVRKRFLEAAARDALRQGCAQIIVFGAGFDTLALRLTAAFPHATFIEVDHPATQQVKATALAARGLLGRNLHLVPLDLGSTDPGDGFAACDGYRPERRTLCVAEGLLMYLEAARVDALFAFAARHPAGSRFAFTFMEPAANGRIGFKPPRRLVDLWLRMRGEPFRWGIGREQLPAFLAERGFCLEEIATPETLRRRFLAPEDITDHPLADGDYPCLAVHPPPSA